MWGKDLKKKKEQPYTPNPPISNCINLAKSPVWVVSGSVTMMIDIRVVVTSYKSNSKEYVAESHMKCKP